jgi:hypothetical protein|uniref:Collagen-like protein n=1 Tax=Siphoviridae sp. ct0Wl9 TaxID=2827763 RepID=A0A8S5T8W5_9CAUD|nr:MAG TPA: hypothetical protein [Siphoviridae sp. ct0Wl9]
MDSAIEELIKSFNYMLTLSMKETTKCYDGIVLSSNNNGKWNVKYNGEIHALKGYGTAIPNVNTIVKVIVPQGNQALAWFFVPIESSFGEKSATFIPSVSETGMISWSNDGGLPNPTPVNIKGPQGEQGLQGEQGEQGPQGNIGPQGSVGPYFTPSVDKDGNLSWTNNGDLSNPNTVNIRGPQGIQGVQGVQGNQGDRGPVGPYFIPSVSTEGILSWANTGGLDNPDSINIQGPQGEPGPKGETGSQGKMGPIGATGPYFIPSVDSAGNLSWSNNGGLENPQIVNISGPQGIEGPQGPTGANGKSAYQYAQDGGFSGSESDFASDLANIQNGPFLPITGGTLTGNLTGQYITGTWLQGTASNQLQTTPQRICVQDTSGWIYSRTPSQILGDIGGAPKYIYSTTDLVAGSSSLSTGVMYLVYE